jgi:hypothetical protein
MLNSVYTDPYAPEKISANATDISSLAKSFADLKKEYSDSKKMDFDAKKIEEDEKNAGSDKIWTTSGEYLTLSDKTGSSYKHYDSNFRSFTNPDLASDLCTSVLKLVFLSDNIDRVLNANDGYLKFYIKTKSWTPEKVKIFTDYGFEKDSSESTDDSAQYFLPHDKIVNVVKSYVTSYMDKKYMKKLDEIARKFQIVFSC